jgi:hypothetical protein
VPLKNTPDQKRFLLELALTCGRSLQKKETGFVHSASGTTISFYDNLCFVLTLLKTRTVENILEARALLEKLLAFDTFPVQLHEYPHARDRSHPIRLLVPLILIDREFSTHIDVKDTIRVLWEKGQDAPNSLVKSAIAHLLDGAPCPIPQPGDDITLAAEILQEEWGYDDWNSHLGFAPSHPEISLYDFAMALKENSYPARLLKPHRLHLQLALLSPRTLMQKASPNMVCTLDNGFALFFGDKDCLNTLFSEGVPSFDNFRFTYPQESPQEGKEVELSLLWNYDRKSFPLFNGKRATLGRLEDIITINVSGLQCTLSFHLLKGDGDFTIHCSRRDDAMWKLSVRTLRRCGEIVIECRINIRQIEGEASTCQFLRSGNIAREEKLACSLAEK